MRVLTSTRQITIDGTWSVEDGKSALLLNAVERKDQPEGKLRSLLFAWHKASWYGTNVEEIRLGSHSILKLSPLVAIDYLSSPAPVRLLQIHWTERLSVMIQLAGLIRKVLLKGWFVPDWTNWTETNRSWRVSFPDDEIEISGQWETLLQEAVNNGDIGIDRWLSEAVEEMMVTNEELQTIWASIGAESGESVLRRKGTDEQEWLIAIGVEKDTLPFRTALQLIEPSDGNGWLLRPVLQDREGGAWFPIGQNVIDGDWIAVETDEHLSLPTDWQPVLTLKMDKEVTKWINVLPHLEDEMNNGTLKKILTEQEAWAFLEHGSIALLEAGSPVLLPAWWEVVRSRKLRLKAKMKSSVGSSAQSMFGLDQIVQFDWKLALGDINLSENEFLKMAEENRRLFRVGDEWVHLDPQDVDQIKQWLKRVGKRKGLSFRDVLEMHLRGGTDLDISGDLESELRAEVELNEHLHAWLEQLQHISQIPLVDPPEAFLGELRPYQQQGVSWLLFLRKFGLGGVLADDMGLGKTIQFMAYLMSMKVQESDFSGPSLLICPTSVIGNWEKELKRFAPSLRVMLHYGNKRFKGEELEEEVKEVDLVITSYSLAQLDEEELTRIHWNALCLDEAQNIKNVYTKQSTAIRRLSARHRIALTGTPMENRLTELWSIYDFINPGYLGTITEFRKAIVVPIERTRDKELIEGLQRWVKPFMLRRVKKDPLIQLSLPDKIESKSYMTLTAEQGALYENIVSDLMEKLDKLDAMQRRGLILATLTKLKQLCNHPALMLKETGNEAWSTDRSNKMARLLEMCEEIAAEGERCLIFTQYVEMGTQIQSMLEEGLGMPVPYLHGGVPKAKRDDMITKFQSEEENCCAFVLSLKAGGTGLNLTAANHVFHYDRWWNPAVENQATDRAFRIGQTKQVQVHKFISLGTLEEKIDEMIESKQSLNDQVVGQSENWITELSTDELKDLFALREGWLKG
ncbi:DEAD/DEAH box helicase [Paenibacillus sp. GSMTC-2017]|uniref:DEAD/DEAH box helicase n=1 Tax=Paenibacillus sp. GSMTC-2017 TaxID=2794350 RepID=UPI0018D622BB|nr:DEAD/DEAH box helicase [Paenibacillus sp. GSMTC-2017]MBH5318504.1 DEAD/DEAH box helicase [Paenibacillus sp. GSMTC-2017]